MEARVDVAVTSNWEKLDIDGQPRYLTFYSKSKTLIDIFVTNSLEPDLDNLGKEDYITIGGVNATCDVYTGLNIYVRSKDAQGSFFYLPKGQQDPEKDIETIYESILDIYERMNHHFNSVNPHGINKNHVKLSNIPNKTSDFIPLEAPTEITLATTLAIHNLNQALNNKINSITRESLDIDKVRNYSMATLDDIDNQDIMDKYISIKHVYDIVHKQQQTINEIEPNLIYERIILTTFFETLSAE